LGPQANWPRHALTGDVGPRQKRALLFLVSSPLAQIPPNSKQIVLIFYRRLKLWERIYAADH
jgi:hypothetical protein